MISSRYSITDSLKETSIIGSKIVDENLKIDDSDVNLDQNTLISTDSNEKMNEEEATTVTETLTPVIDSYSSDKVESLRSKTFFSQKKFCFKQIKLTSNNEIPTEYFLGCCTDIFSLFDNFGSSAFLPVKVDIYGNINKLKQKYSSDSKRYQTLQSIVQAEIDENTTNVKNSATDALLWLKRAIWFLKEFLYEFSNRDKPDLTECIYISYQKSLRQYHNWVVRSIFSIAVRSLPSTDLFMQGLCLEQQTYLLNKSEFERQVKQEMKLIFAAIDNILNIINEMYARKKLEK